EKHGGGVLTRTPSEPFERLDLIVHGRARNTASNMHVVGQQAVRAILILLARRPCFLSIHRQSYLDVYRFSGSIRSCGLSFLSPVGRTHRVLGALELLPVLTCWRKAPQT